MLDHVTCTSCCDDLVWHAEQRMPYAMYDKSLPSQ
jgi:hypothetical protein